MKSSIKNLTLGLGLGIFLAACSSDSNVTPTPGEGGGTGKTKYVISALPVGSTGIADYLLTAESLTSGTVSTVGNGKEQDGSYRYYVTHKNRFFSLLYGQGNPGAVTTYNLDGKGELNKVSDFQAETVQVFAPVADDVLTIKVPRSGNQEF